MPSILFICTANLCRSPIACIIFQNFISKNMGDKDWRIESAGTWTIDGKPAVRQAQLVMQKRGLDLSNHRSRLVTCEILISFDLILTMERGQQEALIVEFPQIADRVHLLSEMVGSAYDIRDPIGGSDADFEETANEIDGIFKMGINKINKLVQKPGK